MSKFKKPDSKRKIELDKKADDIFAYKTTIISAILAGIFLINSLLFNGNFVSIIYGDILLLEIFDAIFKIMVIILFFFFMTISLGNYKELTGKPVTWKDIVGLFILSIIQSVLNAVVFGFSMIGLIFIIIYLYLIQER